MKRVVAAGLGLYLLLGISFAAATRTDSPASGVGEFAYLSAAWLPVVVLKGFSNARTELSGPEG